MRTEPLTCEACGRTDHEVAMRLVRYDETVNGKQRYYFATEARCRDVPGCQTRFEAKA
jgi:hypothetical protein